MFTEQHTCTDHYQNDIIVTQELSSVSIGSFGKVFLIFCSTEVKSILFLPTQTIRVVELSSLHHYAEPNPYNCSAVQPPSQICRPCSPIIKSRSEFSCLIESSVFVVTVQSDGPVFKARQSRPVPCVLSTDLDGDLGAACIALCRNNCLRLPRPTLELGENIFFSYPIWSSPGRKAVSVLAMLPIEGARLRGLLDIVGVLCSSTLMTGLLMTGVMRSTENELNEALKGSLRRGSKSRLYDPEALIKDPGVCDNEGIVL